MNNKNLEVALYDLVGAIKNVMLGDIAYLVIDDAVTSLINNWNDLSAENDSDMIDTAMEFSKWGDIKDEIINQ
jgi:hypothetical protein